MNSWLLLIPHSTKASSEARPEFDLSLHLKAHLPSLQGIFAESLAGGRSWLKAMGLTLPIAVYNLDVPERQVLADIEAAQGQSWAFVSDAGYPCIADPGSKLVALAREKGFRVSLFPGTSAIVAAIALSGLDAQRFAFHGYLPREPEARKRALRHLEEQSRLNHEGWQGSMLQVFIETPYRHEALLRDCLECLHDKTKLCVAAEVGNVEELIRTDTIQRWRARLKDETEAIQPAVAVYLLSASHQENAKNANPASVKMASKKPSKGKDFPLFQKSHTQKSKHRR